MRKIILDLAVTLDGFIEGPQGEIDWCIFDEEMNMDAFLEGIDTIFYGRISYELWGNFQPGSGATAAEKSLWENVHAKKKYVFSRHAASDENATFISADLPTKVAEIKQQDGKDIWLYGGATLIRTFIRHNLIDSYRISVHPTVLGAGKPLFEDLQARINLKLEAVNRFQSGVVQLLYSQVK